MNCSPSSARRPRRPAIVWARRCILLDVAGGVLTGAALQRAGLTVLGLIPRNAGIIAKTAAGATDAALAGGASGAGHTDTGKVEDYLKNAWEGAKTGAMIGGPLAALSTAGQRLITPFRANPANAPLAETLDNANPRVPITAGQRTGNDVLRTVEDTVQKLPGARVTTGNPAAGQMEAVTENVMRSAGIPEGNLATHEVINNGFQRVGAGIGRIQGNMPVAIDNDLLRVASTVAQDVPHVSEAYQGSVRNFLERITGSAMLPNGNTVLGGRTQLTPEMAQSIREQLRRAIQGQNGANGDNAYREALVALRDGLDGALERGLRAAGRDAEVVELEALRQQYANLHVLADAISRSGGSGARGTLTPTALTKALESNLGKTSVARGRGDLNDLATASSGLLQNPPDSGTATRWGALDYPKAAVGAVLGPLVNSRLGQRYLGNQVAPTPLPPGMLSGPVVGGAAGVSAPPVKSKPDDGPVDRIINGLLMRGQ